jgi:hypothetical protein
MSQVFRMIILTNSLEKTMNGKLCIYRSMQLLIQSHKGLVQLANDCLMWLLTFKCFNKLPTRTKNLIFIYMHIFSIYLCVCACVFVCTEMSHYTPQVWTISMCQLRHMLAKYIFLIVYHRRHTSFLHIGTIQKSSLVLILKYSVNCY